MKVLGVITARGGSKGIPRKNLITLDGRSLLEHTVISAISSDLSRVIISTDNCEIAAEASKLGVDVPFMRPSELARDETPTIPVLQHAVRYLEAAGYFYDAIFTLQPTNPLRLPGDINGAIKLIKESRADSVISFTDVGEKHPARMKEIDQEGRVREPVFAEEFEGQRRQDLRKYYLRDGSVYLTRRDVLINQHSLKGCDCRAWLIPRERAVNVDDLFDLDLCRFMLQKDISRFPGRPA